MAYGISVRNYSAMWKELNWRSAKGGYLESLSKKSRGYQNIIQYIKSFSLSRLSSQEKPTHLSSLKS